VCSHSDLSKIQGIDVGEGEVEMEVSEVSEDHKKGKIAKLQLNKIVKNPVKNIILPALKRGYLPFSFCKRCCERRSVPANKTR